MKRYISKTLTIMMRHWQSTKLPDELNFPFDLENFCREIDILLAPQRPMFKRGASLPLLTIDDELAKEGKMVWAVYDGDEEEGTKGKEPIAWFVNYDDAKAFVEGPAPESSLIIR